MMNERRVDGAIAPGRLGIGETVEVRTRMGHLVARGDVCGQTPFGITLREDGTNHKFYMAEFFLFFPEEPEVPEVAANMIADAHPDARVRARLGQVAEQDMMGATPKAQKMREKDAVDGEDATDDEEDEETPEEAAAPANDTPDIDVDKLPKDIKQAVMVVQKLDDDQLNYILAQTGQALMSALRRNNVNEADLHGLVQKSQNAIYRILTGKPAREWKKAAGKK
jgi:uncharacterized protein with von Willebrand factor type A (vWA) domain